MISLRTFWISIQLAQQYRLCGSIGLAARFLVSFGQAPFGQISYVASYSRSYVKARIDILESSVRTCIALGSHCREHGGG